MMKLRLHDYPVEDKLVVEWQGHEGQLNIEVIDIFGTSIHQAAITGMLEIDTKDLLPGVYMIWLQNGLARLFVKVN